MVLIKLLLISLGSFNLCNAISFSQNAYDVNLQRMETEFVNKSILGAFKLASFRINRREFAYNVSADLKLNVDKSTKGIIQIKSFRFVSNEYRLKLFDFEVEACDCVKSRFLGALDLRYGDGKSISGCPIHSGSVRAFNQKLAADQFPPNIPAGMYRVQVSITLNKVIRALAVSVYIEVFYKKKQ